MNSRQAYEADAMNRILAPFRRLANISDDEIVRERAMKRRLDAWIEEGLAAIADWNSNSSMPQISEQAFRDFVADEMPSGDLFEERISELKRGWE